MDEVNRMVAGKAYTTARHLFGALGAGGLAVLAGVALAQRSALDEGSRLVAVPALVSVGADTLFAPGRSGSLDVQPREALGDRRLEATDAAPPPSSRAAREAARRATRAERTLSIDRLARVLDRFATGLDARTERKVAAAIHDESRRWGIDPLLTLAIIETESTYRNGAISFVGARGLMQIRPFVGAELAARLRLTWAGHETLHDPVANVTMGVYYLAQLRGRFGDLATALAAYNIGPNAVQALLDEEREVPTGYVRKVLSSYARLLADSPGRSTVAARSGGAFRR